MSQNKISDITRHDIIDFLLLDEEEPFHGRFEMIEFLLRIWPLHEMPSTDSRFETAEQDIWQHMINNHDWTFDYLLKTYLELTTCPDDLFLRFLAECVHPRVVRDKNYLADRAKRLNDYLQRDGFALVPTGNISGWPVYAGVALPAEGISNQGRVRSDNVAGLEHDGLRFRSKQEIYLYDALKGMGVTFAPLPVFLRGGENYQRLEPDFVILKDGVLLVVEVDGGTTHRETPVQADRRLRPFKHEGAFVERVEASECANEPQARACAKRLLEAIERYRGLK
jgi:hypothetical protein